MEREIALIHLHRSQEALVHFLLHDDIDLVRHRVLEADRLVARLLDLLPLLGGDGRHGIPPESILTGSGGVGTRLYPRVDLETEPMAEVAAARRRESTQLRERLLKS